VGGRVGEDVTATVGVGDGDEGGELVADVVSFGNEGDGRAAMADERG
jgi:hypothetical protein